MLNRAKICNYYIRHLIFVGILNLCDFYKKEIEKKLFHVAKKLHGTRFIIINKYQFRTIRKKYLHA